MSEPKTKLNDGDVTAFLSGVENEQRRERDARQGVSAAVHESPPSSGTVMSKAPYFSL